MFQLIHLRFTQPRADPTAFSALQGQMKSGLANQRSNPAFLFNEALDRDAQRRTICDGVR